MNGKVSKVVDVRLYGSCDVNLGFFSLYSDDNTYDGSCGSTAIDTFKRKEKEKKERKPGRRRKFGDLKVL